MADALKSRIEILQMAEAQGKTLRPEHQEELDNYRKQGIAKGSAVGGKPMEAERTAAFLATRLGGALKTLREVGETDPGASSPSVIQEAVRGTMGDTAANYVTGDARQRVETAQIEFLDSALTLGTGAAYTREQLEGYRKSYFPTLGDSAAVIADKAQRRDLMLKSARIKAGSAAPSIDEALTVAAPPVAPANNNPVMDSATAAGAAVNAGIDKAVGITPPSPTTPDGALKVDVPATGDKRMQDVAFRGQLEKLLNDPATSGDQIRAFWQSNGGLPQNASDKGDATSVARGKGGFAEAADAAVRGAADTATLGFSDEIGAGVKTLFDGGTMKDNLRAERATNQYDESHNSGARIAGQLAGGVALPMGAARGAAALGRTGAAYGAGYGFGSAEGDIGDRVGGALKGGALGGVAGYGLGKVGEGVAALGARRGAAGGGNVEGRATLEAGQRQGIDMMPADVGGATTRFATATAAQLPGSAASVRGAARKVGDQALAARDRIAAGVGTAVEPEAAGEAAKTGARAFIDRTSGVGRGAYARAERLASGESIDPANARAALDRNIAELSQVPGGAEGLDALKTLRGELDGQFSVAGIRGMRSALRDRFAENGLRGSDVERRVNQVIDAANDDVVASLKAAGNAPAAKAYAVADRYWRNRLRVIDETLAPIVGKNGEKSGEAVVQALNTAAKGNSARLASFVRSLPPEESETVRATMISQLGRASAGTQDAAGAAFSLPQFLTHWNQMQPGAKRALFDGQTRAALDDLAIVANGTKQSQRFANTSNTGGVVGGLATGATAGLSIATLGKTLAVQYGAGRLLASPAFARWLAKAPTAGNSGAHVKLLAVIAAREPAIAQEVLGLQARLTQATKLTQPIAAEEPDNAGQAPPQ